MCIYTTNDDHLLLSDPGVGILSCGTRFTAQDNVVALVSYIIHFNTTKVWMAHCTFLNIESRGLW